MSEALIIFKAISNVKEQEVLLRRFLMTAGPLTLRYGDNTEIVVQPDHVLSPTEMQTKPITGNSFAYSKRCSTSFDLNNEKYLLEINPSFEETRGVLSIENFFHLQRRKHFRYTLPEDYSAQLSFSRLNGELCSIHCRLNDLSTEGCAVTLDVSASSVQMGDLFQGEVFLGNRDPISVHGKVKNLRPAGNTHLVLGIEFDHLRLASESKIINSITDLQREIYLRAAG